VAYKFDNKGKLRELTAEELAAADKDSSVIVEDRGRLDDGRPYWLYIAVLPSKYNEYMRLTSQHAPIDVYQYGTILRYGFDAEVPSSVKEEMRERYGCDDHFMATLAQDVKAAQAALMERQENNRINDIVAMLKKKQAPTG
jgi:hypothetical protein